MLIYITNQVNVGEAAKKSIVLHSRCMREMYTFFNIHNINIKYKLCKAVVYTA